MMDVITTEIFIENVFLIMQRRNLPSITQESLRAAGREFQDLCRSKDVETDIHLSGESFNNLLASSNTAERLPGNPTLIRPKPGTVLGRKYAAYLPLRATVALVIDLPKIIERTCVSVNNEAPSKSA